MQSSISKNQLEWKEISEGVAATHFSSRTGHQQIYLKKIKASKPSSKAITVFLFHDLSAYHGRFMKMVNWFRSHHPEISFVMMDFLGHGLSAGTRCHIEKFSDLVDDVVRVFELIEKNEGDEWVALGHGLGALAILDVANRFDDSIRDKVDRFIISNFVLNFSSSTLQFQNKLQESSSYVKKFMSTTRPIEIYRPAEILSHAKEQTLYLEDPLIVRKPTFQTLQFINEKVKNIYQDAYFLDKPTLLLQSDSPYLYNKGMDSFSKGFKKGFLTEKKYSNFRHDLYNERDNHKVFNDIADWIQS